MFARVTIKCKVERKVFNPFYPFGHKDLVTSRMWLLLDSRKEKVINKTIGTPDRPVMRMPTVLLHVGKYLSNDYLRLAVVVSIDLQLKSVGTDTGVHIQDNLRGHSTHTDTHPCFEDIPLPLPLPLPCEVLCHSISLPCLFHSGR
jgi:hypothetical protein